MDRRNFLRLFGGATAALATAGTTSYFFAPRQGWRPQTYGWLVPVKIPINLLAGYSLPDGVTYFQGGGPLYRERCLLVDTATGGAFSITSDEYDLMRAVFRGQDGLRDRERREAMFEAVAQAQAWVRAEEGNKLPPNRLARLERQLEVSRYIVASEVLQS